MEQLKNKIERLVTFTEVLSNAATALDEARNYKDRFTPQMLDGLLQFICDTSWAMRDEVRQLKELATPAQA